MYMCPAVEPGQRVMDSGLSQHSLGKHVLYFSPAVSVWEFKLMVKGVPSRKKESDQIHFRMVLDFFPES